ncbi:MAG: zinc carboxypeptidase [Candidatus Riflebacteria bacterium]|nr:zinc carboxypeptidase [Candidatus Riflebacteria bacterium]
MKYLRTSVAVCLCLALVAPLALASSNPDSTVPGRWDAATIVRLHYTDVNQVRELTRVGADLTTHKRGYVELVVPPLSEVKSAQPGLYEVLKRFPRSEVVVPDLDARARRFKEQPDLGVYHTLAEVKAELDGTVAAYPQLAKLTTIGKSIEGRDIWAIRIGSTTDDGKKPAFLFTGLTHSREWISVEVIMGFISTLTTRYASDPEVKALVDGREIWIVPVVNPDGLSHSQTQYQMWRKNRRKNADNTYGVDLNRNYGYKWGGEGASPNPSSDTYRGTGPFSEPCTQAIRDIAKAKKVVTALSFHSYSELILWPWGYTADPTPDAAVFELHGRKMAEISGYTPEQSIELYATTGDFDDYMYGELGSLVYTIELGQEFIPDEPLVAGIVEKNVRCCLYLLKAAADPFPALRHTPLSTTTNAQGPYKVGADLRLSGHPGLSVTSVDLYHRSGVAQEFRRVAMQPVSLEANRYEAQIPGAGYTTHQYYLELILSDGKVRRFPDTGTHDFKVVEKLFLLVADDGGKGYESFYTRALAAAGVDHMVWRVKNQGPPPRDLVLGCSGCLWFTGSVYTQTLTETDQALLKEYLTAGGRLLLFGQDIGYEIKETAFYKEQLKARFVKDSSGIEAVVGTGALGGFSGNIGATGDGIRQQYPDEVAPLAGATVLATYGAGGPAAALAVTSGSSVMAYFAFGLEGVGGEANRAALLGKMLSWMQNPVRVALARSAVSARTSAACACGGGMVASEAMDEELAERLAVEVGNGRLDGVRLLVSEFKGDHAGPARRVARALARRLPLERSGPASEARELLARP